MAASRNPPWQMWQVGVFPLKDLKSEKNTKIHNMNEIINSMSVHTASLEELKDMVTEIKSLKEEN